MDLLSSLSSHEQRSDQHAGVVTGVLIRPA
jgi:hypothetical protein